MGTCFPRLADNHNTDVDRYMEKKRTQLRKRLQRKIPSSNFNIFSFSDHHLISQGGYGTVMRVRKDDTAYALKRVAKCFDRVNTAINEKNILFAIDFPFIVKLFYTFKNHAFIYFVLELVESGALDSYIEEPQEETTTIFWLAQIVLAVEYLHSVYIIHRDIKPCNILVDQNGYLRLTDFDTAKIIGRNGLTNTMCGTVLYLAPEVYNRQPYGVGVDWWSVGTVGYCCLFSEIPLATPAVPGEPRCRIKKPKHWQGMERDHFASLSRSLGDFLFHLMRADPEVRLGVSPPASEVKKHPCFDQINWPELYKKQLPFPNGPFHYKSIPLGAVDHKDLVSKIMELDDEFQDF